MVSSPIVKWMEGVQRRSERETREAYHKFERGDLQGAEDLFRSALELDPCSAICWRGLGTALYRTGKHAEAVQTLEQAIAANPDDSELWRQLGMVYKETRRFQEALPCLNESIKHGGRDTSILIDLAEVYIELHQYVEAAAVYFEIYSATRWPDAKKMYERALAMVSQEKPSETGDSLPSQRADAEPSGIEEGGGGTASLGGHLAFPVLPGKPRWGERIATTLKWWGPIRCAVCGRLTVIERIEENVRESCLCRSCGSNNRKRQIAYVISRVITETKRTRIRSARDLARLPDFVIYNTEAQGALHEALRSCPRYFASEYFGPAHKSGEFVDGVMHQDLTDLSFDNESVDLVISSDVLEHIPHPYAAHAEIHRVLKPGGRHIFTVPFGTTMYLDREIARLDGSGRPVFFGEPMVHGDPMRENEGVPVFRIFGLEMIPNLARLGFRTNYYILHSMWHGIFGHSLGCATVVFDAVKE